MGSLEYWALLSAIFIMAGTVKGSTGIGLPTVAAVSLSLFMPTRDALSIMILPLFFSNALQMFRSGLFAQSWNRYRLFVIVQIIVVILVLFSSTSVNDDQLRQILGVAILVFVAASFAKIFPAISDRYNRIFQIFFGTWAGVFAGLVSVWAPPIVMYLTSRDVDKEEFVRASGFLITLGAAPLVLGYILLGYLDLQTASAGTLMIIPSSIGFLFGEYLRQFMSEKLFKNALLFVFLLLALKMIS